MLDFSQRSRITPSRLWPLAVLVIALGVVGVLLAAWCFANAAWYRQPEQGAETVTIEVLEGEFFKYVARELHHAGIVNEFALRYYAKFFDDTVVYPGTYIITKGMSYQAIMNELHSQDDESVRITIPEGFSLVEMGERIHAVLPEITIAEWTAATSATSTLASDAFVIASGKPAGVDLEGYLFPDTYEFLIDATAEDIASTMLNTMEKRLDEIGAATGDAEGMTMHELLTLASIVEKEVRTAETMKNVADVFLKRLDIGMALQSDATINYIINGDNPSPLYSDLEVESPYNTYIHTGLPPGPISAPGLNALNAVLHPAENPYYYFLTTDEGAIYYAETYEEHLENKSRWLK